MLKLYQAIKALVESVEAGKSCFNAKMALTVTPHLLTAVTPPVHLAVNKSTICGPFHFNPMVPAGHGRSKHQEVRLPRLVQVLSND